MKRKQKTNTFQKIGIPAIVGLLIVSALINTFLIIHVFTEERTNNNRFFGSLIIRAVENVNHPIPEDPMTGNLYIPELHLKLPAVNANQDLGTILYSSYFVSTNNSQLQIASSSDINMALGPVQNATSNVSTILAAVPKYQACVRGVQIYFSNQQGQTLAYKKTLADGRILYFYTNPPCVDNDLLQYAEQINSY